MTTVLLFGDSNTYGTVPMRDLSDARRHPAEVRWPGVLRAALGAGWTVIDEGLPGRTTVHDDPIEGADRNGLRMLPALMESHRPLDAVVIMLGTNDLKMRFSLPPQDIALGLARLVEAVRASRLAAHPDPKILLVAPPPIRAVGCLTEMFTGGHEKSRRLAPAIAAMAAMLRTDFLDAGTVAEMSPVEGIHMEVGAHRALGLAVADRLLGLFPDEGSSS